MPMVRPMSGLTAVVQNLATWRFNWGSPTVSGRFVRRQGREGSGLVSAVLGGVDSVDLEGLFEVAGLREVEGHLHAQPRLGC